MIKVIKTCAIGVKCKGSCISKSKNCLPDLSAAQKSKVSSAVNKLKPKPFDGKISSAAQLLEKLTGPKKEGDRLTEKISVAPELLNHVKDFNRLVGRDLNIKEVRLAPERSYADMGAGLIVIDSRKPASSHRVALFHEMGHFLERSSPKIMTQAKEFIEQKATGPKQLLAKLTGDNRYGSEQAFPGKFVFPYVGKTYISGSTEVISVGLEHFISPLAMSKLYKADPEHFNLIARLLSRR
jgi:hypothetical protein